MSEQEFRSIYKQYHKNYAIFSITILTMSKLLRKLYKMFLYTSGKNLTI